MNKKYFLHIILSVVLTATITNAYASNDDLALTDKQLIASAISAAQVPYPLLNLPC